MQRWKDNNYTNDWAGVPAPQADDHARRPGPRGVGSLRRRRILSGHRSRRARAVAPDHRRANSSRAVPAQSQRRVAGRHHLRDGAAMAERLLSMRPTTGGPCRGPNDVIPRATPGRTGSAASSAADRTWSTSGTSSALSCGRARSTSKSDRCDTRQHQPADAAAQLPGRSAGADGHGARSCARDHVRGELAVERGDARIRAGRRARPIRNSSPFNTSVTVGPTPANGVATARLWVIYRTSNAGDVLPPQTVTVQELGRHAELDHHHHRQHRRAQDRCGRAGAGSLGQHVRGSRRRADQAHVAAAGRRTSSST